MTVRIGNWKQSLLAGAALLGLATSAQAANIDTIPAWDGASFISTWGTPNTATYGQTITPDATQRRLTSMSFELFQGGGTPPQYQAFVYQWDPVTQRIVGTSLFTSGIFTAPSGSFFTKVTINTGNVILTPGQQYVLFLTTSTISGQPQSAYRWGALTNTTTYAGGQFVFFNNGTNFGQLSTGSWSTIAEDLAFSATLNSS